MSDAEPDNTQQEAKADSEHINVREKVSIISRSHTTALACRLLLCLRLVGVLYLSTGLLAGKLPVGTAASSRLTATHSRLLSLFALLSDYINRWRPPYSFLLGADQSRRL